MKLFSFWRRKIQQAPVTENLPAVAPTATSLPVVPVLPLLILKVVQAFPSRGEDRAMRRFFEKTCVEPAIVLRHWQQLLADGLLAAGAVKQGVQYFVLTARGQACLEAGYVPETMISYAVQIEPKGFIATLLRNIAEREKAELI